ncbi:MAG: PAS domain S-box protein [Bacillota bacterium]
MQPTKILMIDDSKVFCMYLRRSLEEAGVYFEVEEKLDIKTGMVALKSRQYDLVFLDYVLPDGDGLSVLQEVRAAGIKTPIIVLTDYGDEKLAVEMMKAGASDYIAKSSITPARLAKSVNNALVNYSFQSQVAQAEQALAEAKVFFEKVVSTAKVLIIGLDLNNKIQLFNNHSEDVLGWSREQVIGKDWLTFFIPDSYKSEMEEILNRLPSLKQGIKFECPVITRTGDERIIAWNNTSLNNSQNEVSLIIWTGIDITNRKKAEDAMKKSEELLRATFEGAAIGIILSDREGKVFRSNQAIRDMLGYSNEEICNMSVFDFTHPDYTKLENNLYRQVLTRKRSHFQIEKKYMRKDGSFMWGRLNVSPISDDEGRPVFTVGMVEDISERMATEESLKRRLTYEKMTSEISMLGMKVEDILEYYSRCVQIMAGSLDVSEIYIHEYSYEKNKFKNILVWSSPDTMSNFKNVRRTIPCDSMPWLMDMIINRKVINYNNIEDIPGEKEKGLLRIQGIKSVLIMPIYVRDKIYGFIGFNESRYYRKWPEEDTALLNTIVQIMSGVIERKQSEEALRKSEAKYRSYFENSQDIVFIISGEYFIDINPVAMKLTGYTREEFLEMNVGQLYNDVQDRIRLRGELFSKGYVKDFPVDMRAKDGTVINVLCTIVLVPGVGDQYELYGIIRDITEQRKTEEALSEEKERLAVTLASIGDGVITTDVNGKIMLANRVSEDITGWKQEEMNGKQLSEILVFVNPEERVRKFIKAGALYEQAIIARDGKRKLISSCSSPIMDKADSTIGYVIVFRDITEQRRLAEQAALSQKMESIGQLAAGIAHEINTPMQYIGDNTRFIEDSFKTMLDYLKGCKDIICNSKNELSYSDCVSKLKELKNKLDIEYLVGEIPTAIEQSLEGIERVSKLVLAMKEFSHPGIKEKVYSDINKAINNTVIISKNEWKYVADLITELDEGIPLVYCDVDQINQVILNMIVNSAQAISDVIGNTPGQKGEIKITTKSNEEYVQIFVSDTGAGIPEDILHKIFDPFFTTKEVGKGTGQGLALAHDIIVNKHEGKIFVESKIGRGTTFIISLPIKNGV